MKSRFLRLLLVVIGLAGISSPALALRAYVLSCGDAGDDQAVLNVISNAGYKAVLGPDLSKYDGTQVKLSKFDVVVLLYSHNYKTDDMPLVGQATIRSFVKAGGGLITGEWTLYESDGIDGTLQTLQTIFPAAYAGNYVSGTNTTFIRATPDPILDANLGPSFSFTTEYVDGAQSKLKPKAGATVYYLSSAAKAGLVGWTRGQGRVLNFSTVLTSTELSKNKFKRLFQNALRWAAAGGGVSGDAAQPEDSALAP